MLYLMTGYKLAICFSLHLKVEEYLRALSIPPPGSQGVATIPLGKHVRDDEQVSVPLSFRYTSRTSVQSPMIHPVTP